MFSGKVTKTELWILLFVLVGLSVLSFNWAVDALVHSNKTLTVPDLTNQSLDEVLTALSKVNLGIKKEGVEFNDQVPANWVIRQYPEAGSQVREGRIVRIVLSQGGDFVITPDLAGQNMRQAELALRNNNLTLGEVATRPSVQYPKDTIMAQSPEAKTVLKKSALVHIVVSNGPPQDGSILTPNFVGKTWDEVVAWAKQSRFGVLRQEAPAPEERNGIILNQSPRPDEILAIGTNLTVIVAQSNAPKTTDSPQIIVPAASTRRQIRFEVPQSASTHDYRFLALAPNFEQEIFNRPLDPGTKHDIAVPDNVPENAKVQIYSDGFLIEVRILQ